MPLQEQALFTTDHTQRSSIAQIRYQTRSQWHDWVMLGMDLVEGQVPLSVQNSEQSEQPEPEFSFQNCRFAKRGLQQRLKERILLSIFHH